ncbi:hypothetical protein [Xanthobacter autotrophicus]|uniref:hypothetical protein n=1 Tax=Xanthobacter autotrophicus TaxID=280 RepID=UPI00372B2B7E
MTHSRTDWLLCRSNPSAPAGVVYFAGTFVGVDTELGGRVLVPTVSLFRDEAATFDEAGAHLLAAMLTTFGPAADAARPWEAMPAQIHVPSPYQPQVKGPDERRRKAAQSGAPGRSMEIAMVAAMELIATTGSARAGVERLIDAQFADAEEGWTHLLGLFAISLGDALGEVPHGCP